MPAKYIGPANPADIVDGTITANPGDTFILELAMSGPHRFMAYQYEPVAKLGERIWKNFKVLHCGNKEDCIRIAVLNAEAWGKIKRLWVRFALKKGAPTRTHRTNSAHRAADTA